MSEASWDCHSGLLPTRMAKGKTESDRGRNYEETGVTGPFPMVDMDYLIPETWCLIPTVADESGWERRVADQLCEGENNRVLLESRLNRGHPLLISEPRQGLGVWVPRRDVPEVAGALLVDLVLGDTGHELSRGFYRSLIDPDQRTWCTVLSRTIEDIQVSAGPALLVREVIVQHQPLGSGEDEIVEEHAMYTVFPPGCIDALELMFWTPTLELGDDMAADAAAIVDTLTVTLGDIC